MAARYATPSAIWTNALASTPAPPATPPVVPLSTNPSQVINARQPAFLPATAPVHSEIAPSSIAAGAPIIDVPIGAAPIGAAPTSAPIGAAPIGAAPIGAAPIGAPVLPPPQYQTPYPPPQTLRAKVNIIIESKIIVALFVSLVVAVLLVVVNPPLAQKKDGTHQRSAKKIAVWSAVVGLLALVIPFGASLTNRSTNIDV